MSRVSPRGMPAQSSLTGLAPRLSKRPCRTFTEVGASVVSNWTTASPHGSECTASPPSSKCAVSPRGATGASYRCSRSLSDLSSLCGAPRSRHKWSSRRQDRSLSAGRNPGPDLSPLPPWRKLTGNAGRASLCEALIFGECPIGDGCGVFDRDFVEASTDWAASVFAKEAAAHGYVDMSVGSSDFPCGAGREPEAGGLPGCMELFFPQVSAKATERTCAVLLASEASGLGKEPEIADMIRAAGLLIVKRRRHTSPSTNDESVVMCLEGRGAICRWLEICKRWRSLDIGDMLGDVTTTGSISPLTSQRELRAHFPEGFDMQTTVAFVEPGVVREAGRCCRIAVDRGFTVMKRRVLYLTAAQAECLAAGADDPDGLRQRLLQGPVCVVALRREEAVSCWQQLLVTPKLPLLGTERCGLAREFRLAAGVHGSRSLEAAKAGVRHFFPNLAAECSDAIAFGNAAASPILRVCPRRRTDANSPFDLSGLDVEPRQEPAQHADDAFLDQFCSCMAACVADRSKCRRPKRRRNCSRR